MSLVYRGTSSDDVKFNVTERRVYNAPAFDVSGIEVPGRSGDILNSQERFKNKAIVYTGFIRSSDFPGDTTWGRLSRGLRTIKAWICGDAGKYHDLTDDYDPGFVRRAFVSGETAISEVLDRPDGATITITFMAEPFMYEESDPIELPETGTASGAIASFEGVAAPLQSLKFNIEPSQDLHGYSYPWPAGGGKNLCPMMPTTTNHSVTFTPRDDGGYTISGTASRGNGVMDIGRDSWTLPAGTYYLSLTGTSNAQLSIFKIVGGTASQVRNGNGSFTLSGETSVFVRLLITNGTAGSGIAYVQVETGSSSTSFSPYSNICPISGWTQVDGKQSGEDMSDYTPITIALGQTVYGGTVDALNGKLVIDRAMITIDGTGWNGATLNDNIRVRAPIPNDSIVWTDGDTKTGKLLCSGFPEGTNAQSGTGSVVCHYRSNGTHEIVFGFGKSFPGVTTAADGAAWLANNPQQVVYELATPIEVDLTPVSVSSLLGQNNIWANTGDTEAVYVEPTENPTEWPSKPRLEITMAGAGTLTVNGKTWSIGAYTGTLICDSEIMDWYDASNLKNSLVSGDGFPELQPGENVITYTGGITKVVAKPRWRTL